MFPPRERGGGSESVLVMFPPREPEGVKRQGGGGKGGEGRGEGVPISLLSWCKDCIEFHVFNLPLAMIKISCQPVKSCIEVERGGGGGREGV